MSHTELFFTSNLWSFVKFPTILYNNKSQKSSLGINECPWYSVMSVTLSPSVSSVSCPCLDYIACSNLYVPAPILSCYVMVDNYLKEHENYLNNDLQTSKATHLPTWDWHHGNIKMGNYWKRLQNFKLLCVLIIFLYFFRHLHKSRW